MEQQFLASLEAGWGNSLPCVQLIRCFFESQEDKCKDKINKKFFLELQFCFSSVSGLKTMSSSLIYLFTCIYLNQTHGP